MIGIFFRQFSILFTKRWLLATRNWKSTVAQILSPIIIVLLLFGFQALSDFVLTRSDEFPESATIGMIPPCEQRNGLECTTMLYTPNATWIQNLMKKIAQKNNLDMKNFKLFTGKNLNGSWRDQYLNLMEYLLQNPNQTQNALFFKSGFNDLYKGDIIPPDPGYILFYNTTAKDSDYLKETIKSLVESILETKSNSSEAITFNLSSTAFPTKFRISAFDVVASNGATWFFLPPMITFFILLTEIVYEKEKRLRLGMRMMGMSNLAYWVVWFLTGVLLISVSTLVLIAAGCAAQFAFFINSNQFCIFLLFFFFAIGIVSFAMFLSTLVSKSETAQTVGYSLILVGFVFQIILSSGDGTLIRLLWSTSAPGWVEFIRWLLTFYPPFNMAKVFSDIAYKSSDTLDPIGGRVIKGTGYTLSDLVTKSSFTYGNINVVVPSSMETFGWLIMSTVVFLFLMWYLDNVLPGEHGSPRPPYFFLQPHYWGCTVRRGAPLERPSFIGSSERVSFISTPNASEINTEDPDVSREESNAYNEDSTSPLRIMGMAKIYKKYPFISSKKDVVAVDNLSLTGEQGEILCLLGHNGAGKTTLVNMLTGLFQPSNGTSNIFGFDVIDDIDHIRLIMGVCPQHDILWPELTAREHLNLFARLKGFDGRKAEAETLKILQEISLAAVADNRVSSFSGGMKRRLSVGISTIGDPKIIFMDEPTTGLDPVNKRGVWHMIQDLKENRVIILTTHSMEEADVLSDKVAIMAYGKLKCVGSSLHLKTRFGTGYRINIITSDDTALVSTVQGLWPELNLEESEAGSLQFTIPLKYQEMIPDILNYLENNKDSLVDEWGLSHATLEEVFLRVTKKSNFKYEEIAEDAQGETSDLVVASTDPSQTNQEDDGDEEETDRDVYDPDKKLRNTKTRDRDINRATYPLRALFRKNLTLQSRQKCTNCCQVMTPVLVIIILVILQSVIKDQLGADYNIKIPIITRPYPMNDPLSYGDFEKALAFPGLNFSSHAGENFTGDCLEFFFYADSMSSLPATGVLENIPLDGCIRGSNFTKTPIFVKKDNKNLIEKELFSNMSYLDSLAINDTSHPPNNEILPDGYVVFDNVDPSKNILSATLSVNTNPTANYHRENNFTKPGWSQPSNPTMESWRLTITQGWAQIVDMIGRAFTNYALIHQGKQPLGVMADSLDSARFVHSMPYMSSANIMSLLENFGSFLYPIALSIQLPVYGFLLVLEKKNKLLQMMKSHGLKMWNYYLINYLFFFVLYSITIAFFWIAGVAIQLRFFVQTDPVVLLLFFVSWGLALISLAFFISAFLSEPRAATVVGYAIALIGTLTAIAICVGVYGTTTFAIAAQMPRALFIWPQFGFTRGIFNMNTACAQSFSCYQISQLTWEDELFACIFSLFLCGIGYFILFLYLDAVLPREYGIPKHPLFPLLPLYRYFAKHRGPPTEQPDEEKKLLEVEQEDPDVAQARAMVRKGNYMKDDPLVLSELRKTYEDGTVAVRNFSVAIKKNTCFGLLGENGAGKTTTISMLTGLFPPTRGTAFVGGYDITKEIDMVHLVMGLCPQFDVLWDDLTCKEHLLFYARLKGIPSVEEDAHVRQVLKEVGLYDARNRMAVNLSGGMRRRLSLAISFVGKSRITFLDEPTTGLDPASRRHIWTIIARGKRNRAIVLTTHSMDEAETLCNNIGILAHGVLRCLGSAQHLRSTHGEGYILTISYNPQLKQNATRFIKRSFMAVKTSRFQGTDQYKLPKSLQVSDVFAKMERESKLHGITDWGINQMGLDDIFQSIVKKAQEELETPEKSSKLYVITEKF